MPKAILLGDMGTEHDGYHVSPVIECSGTVNIDGKGVACVGDRLAPHVSPSGSAHGRKIATGSTSVFIDGKAAAREGDRVDCGGILISLGSSVNIG